MRLPIFALSVGTLLATAATPQTQAADEKAIIAA